MDGVAVEGGVVGDEDEVAGEGLGDEHAVEGVAMGTGEGTGAGGFGHRNRQFLEALGGYCSGNVGGDGVGVRQFADPMLGGDFPGRGGADELGV